MAKTITLKNRVEILSIFNKNINDHTPILFCIELIELDNGNKNIKGTGSHLHSPMHHIEALYPKQDFDVNEYKEYQKDLINSFERKISMLTKDELNNFKNGGKIGLKISIKEDD